MLRDFYAPCILHCSFSTLPPSPFTAAPVPSCLTADQWCADMRTLQTVVGRVYAKVPPEQRPKLAAADVAQGTDDWQRDFLEGCGDVLDVFSYHSYQSVDGTVPYLAGHVFDSEWEDMFARDFANHGGVQRLAAPNVQLWLTETASSMVPAPSGEVRVSLPSPLTLFRMAHRIPPIPYLVAHIPLSPFPSLPIPLSPA